MRWYMDNVQYTTLLLLLLFFSVVVWMASLVLHIWQIRHWCYKCWIRTYGQMHFALAVQARITDGIVKFELVFCYNILCVLLLHLQCCCRAMTYKARFMAEQFWYQSAFCTKPRLVSLICVSVTDAILLPIIFFLLGRPLQKRLMLHFKLDQEIWRDYSSSKYASIDETPCFQAGGHSQHSPTAHYTTECMWCLSLVVCATGTVPDQKYVWHCSYLFNKSVQVSLVLNCK